MATYSIEIMSPGRPSQTETLAPGITSVGRSAENAIVLNDPHVSRRHVEMSVGENGVSIRDIGSANGTRVNDVALAANQWQSLGDGDTVEIGTFQIKLNATLDDEDDSDRTVMRDAERTAILEMPPRAPEPRATPQPPVAAPAPEPSPAPEPLEIPAAALPMEPSVPASLEATPAAALASETQAAAVPPSETLAAPLTVDTPVVASASEASLLGPPAAVAAAEAPAVAASAGPSDRAAEASVKSGSGSPAQPLGLPRTARNGLRGSARSSVLPIALLVIAALLSFPSGVAAWQQSNIMSRTGFEKIGNKVLSKDAVQIELARELSNVIGSTDDLLNGLQIGDLGQLFTSLLGPSGSGSQGSTGASGSTGAKGATGSSGSDLDSLLNSLLGDNTTGSSGGSSPTGSSGDTLGGLLNSLVGGGTTGSSGTSGGSQGSTTKQLDDALNAILGTPGGSSSASGSAGAADNTLAGLIQPIALEELSTLPNTEIANLALDEAHRTLTIVVRQNQPDRVVLNLDEAIDRILAQMGVPVKTADIGPRLGDVLVIDRHDLPFPLRVMRFFDGKTYYLLALTALALAGALYIAADRVRFVLYSGLALAGSAALWIILAKFVMKPWATSQVEHQRSARDAINASYDVIAGTFVHQELIVFGAGIIVALLGLFLAKNGPLTRKAVADVQSGAAEQ